MNFDKPKETSIWHSYLTPDPRIPTKNTKTSQIRKREYQSLVQEQGLLQGERVFQEPQKCPINSFASHPPWQQVSGGREAQRGVMPSRCYLKQQPANIAIPWYELLMEMSSEELTNKWIKRTVLPTMSPPRVGKNPAKGLAAEFAPCLGKLRQGTPHCSLPLLFGGSGGWGLRRMRGLSHPFPPGSPGRKASPTSVVTWPEIILTQLYRDV